MLSPDHPFEKKAFSWDLGMLVVGMTGRGTSREAGNETCAEGLHASPTPTLGLQKVTLN